MLGLVIIIFVGILLYSILVEPYSIKVEKIVIKSEKISSSNKVRIVQLSDLHIQSIGDRELDAIRIVKNLDPDIIVITGDLIDNKAKLNILLEFLEKLTQIAPVYVVYGNWDHQSGIDLTRLRNEMEALGVRVLVNENTRVKISNVEFYIIGVDDPHTGNDNIEKAMKNIPNETFKILLAHSPEIIDDAVSYGIDLVLTGHTHGGQVVIPGYGPLFLPVSKKYRKYSSGLFIIENTRLYVNRGLGTSFLQIRFLCPPEVALIEIGNS